MKKLFLSTLLLFGLICLYADDTRPYIHELSKLSDVIDYPEVPGYGILPFKVFQAPGDWKYELKNGRLTFIAIKKVIIEKQYDNDMLRQKMSFSYSNTANSYIMMTVYTKGARGRTDVIREKLTGTGNWNKVFKTEHLIKNRTFNTSDSVEEHCTADKLTLRFYLTPGAKIDITSFSFQAVSDTLDEKNTPFSTFDGKKIIAVKLPNTPDYWQLFAATRLRKYLYLQTNIMLPLMVGSSPSDNMINIGFPDKMLNETKEKNIFKVSSKKNITVSAGKTSDLVYGSYELLERCGFKFYDRFNQVIPKNKRVCFPEFECQRSTSLTYCYFNLYGDMIGMGYRNKKIIAPALHDRDLPHHNDVFIVPASLFETKPELFALGKDGKRRDPRNRREQPKCFSNPEVRKLYKEAARRYLKAAPHAEYVLLSTCDFHNWCLCSKCRAQDKEGSWTKVYMDMINEVAEEVMPEFPGKKIIAYAYTYTSEPFKDLKMHPSVVIVYAFYKPYFTSDSVNSSYGNRRGWQQLTEWQKSVKNGNMMSFVYPTQFQTRYALTMPFTATCERIKYSKERNFDGFIICGITPQFEGLMSYIWGKLFWNDKADIQQLIREYMEFYYGKEAAPYMVDYFNRIYKHVRENKPSQYCEFPITGSVTPELLADLHTLLDKAISVTPAGGRAGRSLNYHKAVLLFSEIDDYNINNAPINNDYKRFALRAAELIRRLGQKTTFTNYPHPYREVSTWFSYVTGIKIKNKKFWLDPEMKKFLANPEVKPKKTNTVSGNMIKSTDFTGAQYYPQRSVSRENICIRRASSPWGHASAQFSGSDVSKIIITGMTELESVPAIISLNGKTLFSGNIKFDQGSNKWGEFHIDVPKEMLNEKNNKLVIKNTCSDPEGNAPYTYGWIVIWRAELKRNK